jgi:histidine triad (HIT) family protein
MNECVFCKIIARSVSSVPIAETDSLIVIKDIAPKASIHYLIIPKEHIPDLHSFTRDNYAVAGELLMMAKNLSIQTGQTDFRLVMNNGARAGQSVFHAHIHFLAGKKLPAF